MGPHNNRELTRALSLADIYFFSLDQSSPIFFLSPPSDIKLSVPAISVTSRRGVRG